MRTILLASLLDSALPMVIVVFMLFLCILCSFAVMVIVRDIIHENGIRRKERGGASQPSVEREEHCTDAAEETPQSAPASESEESMAASAEKLAMTLAEEPRGGVVFSKSFSMTEKYAALSSEHRAYFDDVVRHALSKPSVKEHKYNASYDYKDGRYRVIRLMIKRGEIVCEFSFIDHDLRDYVNASGVRIRQSATTMKLDEPSAVGAAKDGIDRVCSQIVADRERKKELAKVKRSAKRKERKQAEEGREKNADTYAEIT